MLQTLKSFKRLKKMSMNKDAIQEIQKSTSVPALVEQLAKANTLIPTIIVPKDFEVKNLEKMMANASRYRMEYKTTSIGDFIAYNKKFEVAGATCFVDATRMDSETIFDLGTADLPGHKEHKAFLKLKKTAAFSAFSNISGDHLNQRQASDFVTDWAEFINSCSTEEGTPLTPATVANAMRDITIDAARQSNSQVGDFGASMSNMEKIEAKSRYKIPSEICFSCSPYLGLEVRKFRMRVSILVGGERPQVVFRILQLDAIMEEIAEEFKGILVEAFKDMSIDSYIGEA